MPNIYLYEITGDEHYRWLAQFFYHNEVIDPLKELRDDLGTKHTNTFIPKVLAEARNYELTEDEDSRKLSGFFWHTMRHTPTPDSNPALYNDYYTYDYRIPVGLRTTLKVDVKHPERSVQRLGKELKFTTRQGDVIEPLYNIHRQRYVVY